jgi:hypothetical protein
MKYLIGILFLFIAAGAFAQQQEKPLVQFSGVIHNADSVKAIVPYVSITNKSFHNQVNIANYEGYFSFVAHEQDTLVFTSVGFAPTEVVIPANVNDKSYTIQVNLKPQAIHLPAFRVFPWATTDEFKKDFLTMKIADDDLETARKNIEHISVPNMVNTLPRDGQEISSAWAQNENVNIMNQHSLIPNPLLNPIAWGTLINQIAAGDKSRSSSGD